MRTDDRCLLHAFNFFTSVFNPLKLLRCGRAGVAGREAGMNAAEASPITQVFLGIFGSERTGVLNCEFE